MLMDTNKHPSFSKLLFSEGFMTKMQIPADFVEGNKEMLGSSSCLLRSNVDGIVYKANIVKHRSLFFICEAEWPLFVMHHKLELGDSLFFFLIDKSIFQVLVFTQKTCRNINGHAMQPLLEDLSNCSEEEIGPSSRKSKKARVDDLVELSDSEVESLHDSIDGIYDTKEKLSLVPGKLLADPFKRKCTTAAQEKDKKSGSKVNGAKKIRFSVVNFNVTNPYYEIVVKKSHSDYMAVPISFARWTGIIKMKKITLVNEKGKGKCEVSISAYAKAGSVVMKGPGWIDFRWYNNISCGQTWRFYFIKATHDAGDNVLQVHKI